MADELELESREMEDDRLGAAGRLAGRRVGRVGAVWRLFALARELVAAARTDHGPHAPVFGSTRRDSPAPRA
jgi:hypothetical protein